MEQNSILDKLVTSSLQKFYPWQEKYFFFKGIDILGVKRQRKENNFIRKAFIIERGEGQRFFAKSGCPTSCKCSVKISSIAHSC
jgi:hypothetical protein